MTTLHPATAFNVEATLNAWLEAQLATYTRPSWLPSYTVVQNWAHIPLSLPCFSIAHIDVDLRDRWQGRRVSESSADALGQRASAIMEVSAWASRRDNAWVAQLRTMADMTLSAVTRAAAGVVIQDYATDPANPTDSAYRVVLRSVEQSPAARDSGFGALAGGTTDRTANPNPDIMRRRLLVAYWWTYRS